MRRRDVDRLAIGTLVLLPLVLLLLDPLWAFMSPEGQIDPYIYTGHMRDLRADLTQGLYQGSRLPWLLVGNIAYSALHPEYANLALRLLLLLGGTSALFVAVRAIWANSLTALVAAILLGINPHFLNAIRTDYVDGPAIVLMLATLALLATARRARFWWPNVSGAGFTLMTALSINISLGVFLPVFVFFGLAFSRRGVRQIPSAAVFAAVFAALGAVTAFVFFGLINRDLTGRFNYLEIQIEAARTLEASQYRASDYAWLERATWLLLPAALTVVALAVLVDATLRHWKLSPDRKRLALAAAQFLMPTGIFLVWQLTIGAPLQTPWYASFLTPFAFVFLGGILAAALTQRRWHLPTLAALGVSVLAVMLTPELRLNSYCPGGCSNYDWGALPSAVALLALLATVALRRPQPAVLAVFALVAMGTGYYLDKGFSSRDLAASKAQFLMVYDLDDAVWPHNENGRLLYWYDMGEPLGNVYNGAAALRFWYPRLLSQDFPTLRNPAFPDRLNAIPIGTPVAVISADANALGKAEETILRAGARIERLSTVNVRRGEFTAYANIVRFVPLGQQVSLDLSKLHIYESSVSRSNEHLITPSVPYGGAGYLSLPSMAQEAGYVRVKVNVYRPPVEVCVLTRDSTACLAQESLYRTGQIDLILPVKDMADAGFVAFRSTEQPVSGELGVEAVTLIAGPW